MCEETLPQQSAFFATIARSKCAQMRSTTRPLAQWNLILTHVQLQISNTLEKHENRDKLFELNV